MTKALAARITNRQAEAGRDRTSGRRIETPNGPQRIQRGRVYDIAYSCRPYGPDPEDREEGIVRAYWSGDVDTWGKYTFVPTDGSDTLYLFADELVELDPL
jgi:hypothetical protein